MTFHRWFLEKELDAIVIRRIRDGAQVLTSNFIQVHVPFCPKNEKERVKIKILDVDKNRTDGIVLEDQSDSLREGVE